jgi:hypothetical protein
VSSIDRQMAITFIKTLGNITCMQITM